MRSGIARAATTGTSRTGEWHERKPDAAARRGGRGPCRGGRSGRVEPHRDGRGWPARATASRRACPAPGLTGSPAAHLALIAGPASAGTGRAVVTHSGATQGTPVLSLTQPGVLSLTGVH